MSATYRADVPGWDPSNSSSVQDKRARNGAVVVYCECVVCGQRVVVRHIKRQRALAEAMWALVARTPSGRHAIVCDACSLADVHRRYHPAPIWQRRRRR